MKLKQYAVYIEWDSYSGSQFRETSTAWVYTCDEQDARRRARAQHRHHKGFEIKFVDEEQK